MSQKYEQLKTLLRELFQLDHPDLDFGLYRVMHAKSAEVSRFLDEDLLPRLGARLRTAVVGTMQPDRPQPRTTTRSQHR